MTTYVITVMCKGQLECIFTTRDFWKANDILETVSADDDVDAWMEEVED